MHQKDSQPSPYQFKTDMHVTLPKKKLILQQRFKQKYIFYVTRDHENAVNGYENAIKSFIKEVPAYFQQSLHKPA
jgi:hypothetical protein